MGRRIALLLACATVTSALPLPNKEEEHTELSGSTTVGWIGTSDLLAAEEEADKEAEEENEEEQNSESYSEPEWNRRQLKKGKGKDKGGSSCGKGGGKGRGKGGGNGWPSEVKP